MSALRGHLQWRHRDVRKRSRLAVDAIVGPTSRRDAFARQHLAQTLMRERLVRRPWMVRATSVEGVGCLRSAHATGRGVLVSYCHLGPFPGIAATVAEHVTDVHQVAGAWLAAPLPTTTLNTRWHAWRSIFHAAGVPLVNAEGCFDTVAALLRRGAVVVMAFDWPGSAETMFLGRPAMLASGTARLAHATGACIVPTTRRFRRWLPHTVFDAPLDPAHHAQWRDLHDALAAMHGRRIRERPAALEDPRRGGAWEDTATAERWGPRE